MEIVGRATVVFFFLLLLMRGMRKRTLGDMSPLEMILLVVIGDLVQQGVTQEDYSLTGVGLGVGTFAFWITLMNWVTWRFERGRRLIEGVPIVLVDDGRPVVAALTAEQIPWDEVLEAARQQGIDDIATVKLAVLEVSGRISFIPASS